MGIACNDSLATELLKTRVAVCEFMIRTRIPTTCKLNGLVLQTLPCSLFHTESPALASSMWERDWGPVWNPSIDALKSLAMGA